MINNSKIKVSMFSSAEKVEGQGVASAYREQVELVKELPQKFEIIFNKLFNVDIAHFHTIDLKHYFLSKLFKRKGVSVAYVHFLPETVDSSLNFPALVETIFFKNIIKFYQSMDYLVTVNPYFINKLVKHGIDREKNYYIPNYVSNENFYPYPADKKLALRKEMEIDEDKFVVLGVGQIQNRKGVLKFVEVAREFPEVKFIWAASFVIMITSFVPVPEASGGAEISFYYFFSLFFLKEQLLIAIFIWRFISYYSALIIGGLIIFINRETLAD